LRGVALDTEEGTHAFGRRIGDADERTSEHVPIEANGLVEVGNGDADVAE